MLLTAGVALALLHAPSAAEALAGALLLGAAACALGWQATWYLQASEQLHRWAWVEIAVYAVWALAVLALGHSALAYLALQVLATTVLAGAGWWWLRHDLREPAATQALWTSTAVRPGLRLGWTMLSVSVAGAAYSYALPAVASATMSRSEIGVYFLADRIVRAVLGAADPVFQIVYPRIVAHFHFGARAAWFYTARWAVLGAVAGGVLLLAGVLAWPQLSGLLAAQTGAFDAARVAPVMLTLGLLLPLLLSWKFFGFWMLGSRRYDHAYRACVVVGGLAGVAGAGLFGAHGAAALSRVAVAVECLVIAAAVAGIALTHHLQNKPRAATRKTG
jgi:O-antigen/teichoic acid export membrane protein